MSRFTRITSILGSLILIVLLAFGVFAHVWVIPNLSHYLVDRFSEFQNNIGKLEIFLSVPVILAEVILVVTLYLIYLINREKMFTASVYKWIWLLAGASIGLFIALVSLFKWLDLIGALPPIVAIFLSFSSLLSLAIGFVILTMLGLLKKATQATQDLEGVI